MASGNVSYPSVFVVDGHMRPPPLPPKPASRHRKEAIQTLLFILVTLALFGMAVEACFIYRLYSVKETIIRTDESHTAMSKQDKVVAEPKKNRLGEMKPSKPMGQLTTGLRVNNEVVLWHENHDSILHFIKHKSQEGKLIIEKEGFYSVYSKINYKEESILFTHSVVRNTQRFAGEEILLLQSSSLHPKIPRPSIENSFLNGVFHLYKDDAIFVRVKNCTIVLSNSAENYFGLFMI
ncbi:tumor necrosis factor ligand superfamily member 14 [Danio rerio]|uniref:Light n=1 Tax=Danio rerio TaxID=7955 RepID=E7FBC0_DANRE|nr:tumor necrosis factor ligand superfamily member 14 [Danio rerio]AFN06403.1 light [Danio rerio]|eukprot:NP_001268924.1 uncharacterized protein LOC798119 [Danio rerio]